MNNKNADADVLAQQDALILGVKVVCLFIFVGSWTAAQAVAEEPRRRAPE